MTYNFENPAIEWTVYKDNNFSVVIRNWKTKTRYPDSDIQYKQNPDSDGCYVVNRWNVYAHIFDTHRLFDKPETVMNAPFHGGCNYEQKITFTPALGLRYDWQKEHTTYKFGCDYAHLYDSRFEEYDGKDGVPYEIQNDAKELVEWLKEG